MNLLITGGLGYLGYEVLQAAAEVFPGDSIVVIGRRPLPSGIPLPENTVYKQGSVLDEAFLQNVMKRYRIVEIVHAAGARTSECAADPHQAIESNVFGTDAVFRAARAWGRVEKIVFVSSGAVYGRSTGPINEKKPLAAGSPYAVAKAAAEMVARGHTEKAGFQTAIVRPGFVMGPSSSGVPKASKLNAVVGEAMSQPLVDFLFVERFFVHLAADLGTDLVTLLRSRWSEQVDVFHLPGCATDLDHFISTLKTVVDELGRQPAFKVKIDDTLDLPGHLDFGYFESVIGSGKSAPKLGEMLRMMVASEGD